MGKYDYIQSIIDKSTLNEKDVDFRDAYKKFHKGPFLNPFHKKTWIWFEKMKWKKGKILICELANLRMHPTPWIYGPFSDKGEGEQDPPDVNKVVSQWDLNTIRNYFDQGKNEGTVKKYRFCEEYNNVNKLKKNINQAPLFFIITQHERINFKPYLFDGNHRIIALNLLEKYNCEIDVYFGKQEI